MSERDSKATANRGVKVAVGFTARIVTRRARFHAAAVHVHVAKVSLNTEDDPVPLEIVTDLTASNDARLVIAPWFRSVESIRNTKVVVEVLVLTVTPLSTDVHTEVKSGPIALRQRRRRDFFHFLSAGQWFRTSHNG